MPKDVIKVMEDGEAEEVAPKPKTFGSALPKQKADRELRCVFVSDGVYKYVYADTGEEVQ